MLKVDLQNKVNNQPYVLPKGHFCGEFLFVASDNSQEEDDGYLSKWIILFLIIQI